jgi:hypothetical protein
MRILELELEQQRRAFLASKQITVLEHPPSSPDVAHSVFFSAPKGKGNIERKAF